MSTPTVRALGAAAILVRYGGQIAADAAVINAAADAAGLGGGLTDTNALVTVQKVEQATNAGRVAQRPGPVTVATNVPCQIKPEKASAAYEATLVNLNNPYKLTADIVHVGAFAAGNRVIWPTAGTTLTMTVRSAPARDMASETAGTFSVICEALQFAATL